MVLAMRQEDLSLRQIGAALPDKGVRTARGGVWSADAVPEVILRAELGAVQCILRSFAATAAPDRASARSRAWD
jgi:hypothetical protein